MMSCECLMISLGQRFNLHQQLFTFCYSKANTSFSCTVYKRGQQNHIENTLLANKIDVKYSIYVSNDYLQIVKSNDMKI